MAVPIKGSNKLIISVSIVLLLFLPACGPPESGNTTGKLSPPYAPPPKDGADLTPAPQPDKGNKKLDSFLNQLIAAEKQGGAEAFARQRNVQLIDGKIRVQIDAKPGQLDIATNMTAKFGTVEIISRRLNAVQAVVPITNLTALAEGDSIRGIVIPVAPAAQ